MQSLDEWSREYVIARAKEFWDAVVTLELAIGGDHDNHEDSL